MQRLVGAILQQVVAIIRQQHLCAGRQCHTCFLQPRQHALLGDQHRCLAVFDNIGDTLGGISRVHRHIGRTGFHHAQVKRRQPHTTTQTQRHALATANALPVQPVRHPVTGSIQRTIILFLIAANNRDRIRRDIHLPRQQIQQGFTGILCHRCALPLLQLLLFFSSKQPVQLRQILLARHDLAMHLAHAFEQIEAGEIIGAETQPQLQGCIARCDQQLHGAAVVWLQRLCVQRNAQKLERIGDGGQTEIELEFQRIGIEELTPRHHRQETGVAHLLAPLAVCLQQRTDGVDAGASLLHAGQELEKAADHIIQIATPPRHGIDQHDTLITIIGLPDRECIQRTQIIGDADTTIATPDLQLCMLICGQFPVIHYCGTRLRGPRAQRFRLAQCIAPVIDYSPSVGGIRALLHPPPQHRHRRRCNGLAGIRIQQLLEELALADAIEHGMVSRHHSNVQLPGEPHQKMPRQRPAQHCPGWQHHDFQCLLQCFVRQRAVAPVQHFQRHHGVTLDHLIERLHPGAVAFNYLHPLERICGNDCLQRMTPFILIDCKRQHQPVANAVTQGIGLAHAVQAEIALHRYQRQHGLGAFVQRQQATQLRIIHQLQAVDTLIHIAGGAIQYAAEMFNENADSIVVEQIGVEFQHAADMIAVVRQHQGEIETGRHQFHRHGFDFETAYHGFLRRAFGGGERQRHLINRRETQVAWNIEIINDGFEGHILMTLCTEHLLLHLGHELAKGRFAFLPRANHQRVDEKADQSFHFRPRATSDRHTHAEILLPRPARQHDLVDRQQDDIRRGVELTRDGLDLQGERLVEANIQHGAIGRLHRRTRTVERQHQLLRRTGQLRAPITQLPFQHLSLQPVPLPLGKITVLNLNRRQGRIHAHAFGCVQRGNFPHEDAHRPAIGHDVMHHHQQAVAIIVQLVQMGAQQRALFQFEWRANFPLDTTARFRITLADAQRGQIVHRHDKAFYRLHDLHGLIADDTEHGAQGFVALQQFQKRFFQRRQIEYSSEEQWRRNMESAVAGRQLLDKPEPVLRMGQRQRLAAIHHWYAIGVAAADAGAADEIDDILFAGHQRILQLRCQCAFGRLEFQLPVFHPQFDAGCTEPGN